MVYGLVFLVCRRNLQFSAKTLQHSKFLFERKLPTQVLSFPQYCKDSEENDEKPKEVKAKPVKEKPMTPSFSDGKSHLDHIIKQAKRGRISATDLSSIARRVVDEAQYQNYKNAPQTIQYICLGGLVPMLGAPLMSLLSGHAWACLVHAHLACGATILSFLGGSNWYEAISKDEVSYERLGWTLVPAILGWTSLMLPVPLGMLCQSFGFCVSLVHDVLLTNYPPWMKSIRLVLTAGTLLSFVLMLLFYIVL